MRGAAVRIAGVTLALVVASMGIATPRLARAAAKPIAMYEDLKTGQFYATPGKNRVYVGTLNPEEIVFVMYLMIRTGKLYRIPSSACPKSVGCCSMPTSPGSAWRLLHSLAGSLSGCLGRSLVLASGASCFLFY